MAIMRSENCHWILLHSGLSGRGKCHLDLPSPAYHPIYCCPPYPHCYSYSYPAKLLPSDSYYYDLRKQENPSIEWMQARRP
jgi:hypothetical protein